MPYPSKSIGLSAGIGVKSSTSDYPSHYDELGAGGYRAVLNKAALDAIPASRRRKGMLVRVLNTTSGDNLAGKILYYNSNDDTAVNDVKLVGDSGYPASSGWNELQVGGSTLPSQSGNNGKFLTTDGSSASWATVSGTGTVTSVAMTGDNVLYSTSVSGSPITNSGTLAPALKTQSANTIFAGPSSGGAATPTFRTLVSADIPNNAATTTGNAGGLTNILNTDKGGTGLDLSSGGGTNNGLLYSDTSGNTLQLFKSSSATINAIPTVDEDGTITERLQNTIQNIISTTEGVSITNTGVASATFKLGSDSIDTANSDSRIKGTRTFNIKTTTDSGKVQFISDNPSSAVEYFGLGNGTTNIANTFLALFTNGTLSQFFSTNTIAIPATNGTTTLKTSNLPLDAANTSANTGTTIVNHSSTTNITNLPTAEYSSGNAFTYTVNQHTFTLPQKSGSQDNVGIGTQNSTINMFRYFLTNSIWNAASGGSGAGYINGTWELARLYSTGLSSNTSSLSGGSTRISQSGATFFTLATPGHKSVFRVLVGDRTIGQDVVTLGYDTVTFPTADTLGNITISSYSGQVLNFGVSANTFASAGITGTPGATTSYFAISSGNESFLPDLGTASTGPTATGVTLGNYVKSSTTTGIVGTSSRALNWRVRTFTPVASTFSTTYNYGRQITLNMVAKSYPHYSNSKTLDNDNSGSTGYAYDFRQRWLLFPITPTPTANNNPSAGLNSPPTFYNSTTSLLDGSNTNDPIRAIDILSGPYSTTSPTSGSAPNPIEAVSKSSQVAVGISLGSGEVPSAKVTIGKSTTLQAAMKLYVGLAPSSPQDGDIWLESNTTTGLKIRLNGQTRTITLSPL